MVYRLVDAILSSVMGVLWRCQSIAKRLASLVFIDPPNRQSPPATFEAFADRILDADGEEIEYPLSEPKSQFLQYLAAEQPVVFHGSNNSSLTELEPRSQRDYRGKETTAVFATRDPLWALFFAILDQEAYTDSLRNGGFLINADTENPHRRYFFSLSKQGLQHQPWTNGTLYVLPQAPFTPAARDGLAFDEWYAHNPVQPVACLQIQPHEFPFLEDVVGHDESESMFTSWTLYPLRRYLQTHHQPILAEMAAQ